MKKTQKTAKLKTNKNKTFITGKTENHNIKENPKNKETTTPRTM